MTEKQVITLTHPDFPGVTMTAGVEPGTTLTQDEIRDLFAKMDALVKDEDRKGRHLRVVETGE